MKFEGNLEFRGAAPFRWLQQQGDGTVELLFSRNNRESTVAFSADAWAAIKAAADKLAVGAADKNENRITVRNPLYGEGGKGQLRVEGLAIAADEQPIRFDVEVQEMDLARDRLPIITMKNPGDKGMGVELVLNPKAARELRDRLDKVLEAHAAVKVLAKPKTIPAAARA